jgi:ABC-2 type transport system ATP-binding protein
VLDEPVAMLDPVARHDFMDVVLAAVKGKGEVGGGVSVLLSSHVLAELERVADYLVLLSRGQVQVAGEVEHLLSAHRVLTGPAAAAGTYAGPAVVHLSRDEAQAHLLVRVSADDPVPPGWQAHPVGLEELALAYLREAAAAALPTPPRTRDAEQPEVTR